MSCLILFPNQLFEEKYIDIIFSKINNSKKHIILWEHDYFFKEFPYHKMKLAFHRATMKFYYKIITYNKLYVESTIKNQHTYIIKFIEEIIFGCNIFFIQKNV